MEYAVVACGREVGTGSVERVTHEQTRMPAQVSLRSGVLLDTFVGRISVSRGCRPLPRLWEKTIKDARHMLDDLRADLLLFG